MTEGLFDWYPAHEVLFARVQLVLFMLGMGATLAPSDFLAVVRCPRPFLAALAGQLLVIPWLAVALNHLFGFEGGIAVGMILVAVMPGGSLSKVFTYLGHGNVPLSISLSALTTLACLVTVPLMLQLLASGYMGGFTMPVRYVVAEVTFYLLLPLLAGMATARLWPRWRTLLARVSVRLGLVVVLVIVVGSLGAQRIRPGEQGLLVPLAIILFVILGMQLNMLVFYLLGWPRADRMAAGIEVTMRNMNLAILLQALLPEEIRREVLFVALFYAAAAMGAGLPLALNHRRMALREQPRLAPALEPCEVPRT